MPRTHARLTIPPPERPKLVSVETHQESLRRAYDRHSALRRDDSVGYLQPLVVSLMIFVLFVNEHVMYVTTVGASAAHLGRIEDRHRQPRQNTGGDAENFEVRRRRVEEDSKELELRSFDE